MSNLSQMGSSVQNLAKQYKAVIEVGAFLDSLGSLDNLANEIEARVEKAKQDEQTADAAFNVANTKAAALEAQNAEAIAVARSTAESIVAEGHVTANAIKADAATQADENYKAMAKRSEEFEYQSKVAKEALDAVNADVARSRATLESLNSQIEAVRAKFA